LVGSTNYFEGVKLTGINRSINREKFNYNFLETLLTTDGNPEKIIFSAYKRLISIRINEAAFNPFGKFEFLDLDKKLFAILRHSVNEEEHILAIHSFSQESMKLRLPKELTKNAIDLLSDKKYIINTEIEIEPYQVLWLKFTS